MIQHVVFFTFKEEALNMNKEELKVEAKKQLEDLVGKINEIEKLIVGINYNTSLFAFDMSLYTEFATEESLEAYQLHPEHVKVKDFMNKVVMQRAVVDAVI